MATTAKELKTALQTTRGRGTARRGVRIAEGSSTIALENTIKVDQDAIQNSLFAYNSGGRQFTMDSEAQLSSIRNHISKTRASPLSDGQIRRLVETISPRLAKLRRLTRVNSFARDVDSKFSFDLAASFDFTNLENLD